MKKLFSYTLISIALLLVSVNSIEAKESAKKVSIEIKYNDESHLPLKIETNWKEGLTALEALQFVAEVKTHPVGGYVFVSEINGIAGQPNSSVWYYKINGIAAKKVAINQALKSGDTITWIYKQDVCSLKN